MKKQSMKLTGRRTRVWATTPEAVATLSRAAQQVARRSASRIAEPRVAGALQRLRDLLEQERDCRLAICDLVLELVDGHGLRAIDIAREIGRRPSDLSEMLMTARGFPPGARPAKTPYNHLMQAARVVGTFPSLALTPASALKEIQTAGLTQHRDVTRLFSTMHREAQAASASMRMPTSSSGEFDQPYHSRFQDLLSLFPDGSIHLLHLDPPYAFQSEVPFTKSASSAQCDNADPAAAIAMVVDLLQEWQPKLATDGVVLLWQPWGVLHPDIVSAIADYKWGVWGPVVWDKGRPQPGGFVSPYAIQAEMLYVLHRLGEVPRNCDGSSRESILRVPPVSFPSKSRHQIHAFEKPVPLMERLLLKHSRPGDLVFDACGCTASMSKAAIDHGRRWVYAESNAANYRLGVGRINRTLPPSRPTAVSLMH